MSSSFRPHRFHVIFFVMLYVSYFFMLFVVAQISDIGNIFHTFTRIAAASIELGIFYLSSSWLLARWQAGRRIVLFLLYIVLGSVFCLIYLAQIYSLYLSNNFVSVLGMQNLHYASLGVTWFAYVAICFGAIWLACFGTTAWFSKLRNLQNTRADVGLKSLPHRIMIVVTVIICLLVYVDVLGKQREHIAMEPTFEQTPIASFLVNAIVALNGDDRVALPLGSVLTTDKCFENPSAGIIKKYPFQRETVYKDQLPFSTVGITEARPNVIVFFTEGTSTRLIGAYGGKYPGLTPNIDRLAGRSMKVVDYYNHTAATFRGIVGQTSSGYAYAGGSGQGGWEAAENRKKLAGIKRQTLATILDASDYATYFFEPEIDESAFSVMLESLGFKDLYGYQQIANLLHGSVVIQDKTKQLADGSLFRGLTAFLEARAIGGNTKPFFIGTYNIGTHAFIPVVSGGEKYGNGDSEVLNKLHNYDAALGKFMDYFYASPYAKNTILVFTSDHTNYPDKPYRDVAGVGLRPFFVDTIPLLIYDPLARLPRTFDADGRNSLDMAPTLLQLLGIKDVPNSFLGRSLFEPRSMPVGMSALGDDFYVTTSSGVRAMWEVSGSRKDLAQCEKAVVDKYYQAEKADRLFSTGLAKPHPSVGQPNQHVGDSQ